MVKVKCIGHGCPKRTASSTRSKGKVLRMKWLEHRLRAGTRITISVTRSGYIGSYTSLRGEALEGRVTQRPLPGAHQEEAGDVPLVRLRPALLAGLVAAHLLIPAASASAPSIPPATSLLARRPAGGRDVTFTPKDLADPEILPILGGIKSVTFDFGDGSEVTDSEAPFDDKTHAYRQPRYPDGRS